MHQAPETVTIANSPCCMVVAASFKCRSKSAYQFKCGYVPDAFSTEPKKFFRNINCTTSYDWSQTLTYTYEDAHPGGPFTGTINCTYSYTKTGCEGDGDYTATYDVHISELTGDEADDTGGTDGGAGTGAEAACIEFPQPVNTSGFPPPVFDGFGISEREEANVGPIALMEGEGGCYTGTLATGATEASGTRNPGTSDEYNYLENEEINASVQFCSEFTLSDLVAAVAAEMDGEEWSEWEDGQCCAWHVIPYNEETYSRGDLQIRLDLAALPCAGTVRVTYYTVDSADGSGSTPEVGHDVDVTVSGTIIDIDAPEGGGYRCVKRVEARIL